MVLRQNCQNSYGESRSALSQMGEVHAVDDIAPLVRSAHLEKAAVAAVQLHEIVGLQDHVVEFEERQGLFPVEPRLHAFERQHPVDREMPPDIAQEIEVVRSSERKDGSPTFVVPPPISVIGRPPAFWYQRRSMMFSR